MDLKAIKNQTELKGFREGHIRDGAALASYFSWLEESLKNGEKINEFQGASKLEEFRTQLEMFKGQYLFHLRMRKRSVPIFSSR